MDISLERRGLSRYREVFRDTSHCELSADCVIPDTQGDILRIIKCEASAKLKSKDVSSDSVTIGGELSGEILYVPEAGEGVSILNFSIPFENETHLRDENVCQSCIAELSVVAADVRVLNPRKVSVRAEVQIRLRCYDAEELSYCASVNDKPDKLFCKSRTEPLLYPSFVGEKQLSLDEEVPCDAGSPAAVLLSGSSSYYADGIERVGSKLILKGHADISAIALDGEGNIITLRSSTPFSQLFEMSGEADPPYWDAVIVPTAEYYSLENGNVNADLHAVIQLTCYAEADIEFIEDAYFCGRMLQLEHEELGLCRSVSTLKLTSSEVLEYDAGGSPVSVVLAESRLGKIKLTDGSISIPVSSEAVYTNSDGELCCGKARGCLEFELPSDCGHSMPNTVEVTETTAQINGSSIEIRVTAILTLECTETVRISAISGMSADDTQCVSSRPSLYLCRCRDRDLWTLAKAYGSSEDAIISANKLTDGNVLPDAVLLIPKI